MPVGAEGYAHHPTGMPRQRAERLTGVGVPRSHRAVVTAGGQSAAIRAERDGDDLIGMAGRWGSARAGRY